MTVARADANGVNPGAAVAVAPDGKGATPKTGSGSASSPGGPLPDAPVQRGQKVGGTQPIRTDRIEKAIDHLIVVEDRYKANRTEENKARVDRAMTQVNIEYENEVERGVRSGPFDHYPASAGVRSRAELLAAAFEGKKEKSIFPSSVRLSSRSVSSAR